MKRSCRALIGGGGYSGLACAHGLREHGVNDVLLLEARDRPGGRAHTDGTLVPGKFVDRGPEFFGDNHPTVLRFADAFGVRRRAMFRYEGPFSPILDGCGLSIEERASALREMQTLGLKLVEMSRSVLFRRPWESPGAKVLDHTSLGQWLNGQVMSDLARRAFDAQVVANHGVSLDRLSLLAFLSIIAAHGPDEYMNKTELYRLEGGAQELAKRMAASMSDIMLYGRQITAIENRKDKVIVTCSTGEVFEADYFVLCLPPSVWSSIDFSPGLPAEAEMQMGMNVKAFAVLDGLEDFDAGLNPYCFSNDGLLHLIWDTTEGQEFAGHQMVITCFSGGDKAVALSRKTPGELWEILCRELAESVPRIRTRLKKVDLAGWPRDPLTRAGYSAPAPGQMTTTLKLLRKGFGRMKVAGEHTAYQMAFVSGAFVRGFNVAGEIIQEITGQPCPLVELVA